MEIVKIEYRVFNSVLLWLYGSDVTKLGSFPSCSLLEMQLTWCLQGR